MLSSLLLFPAMLTAQKTSELGWPTYGNDPGGTRYSPAKQIDRERDSVAGGVDVSDGGVTV